MGPQRAPARDADAPDGFGVAVVREDGKWRCSPMRSNALTSLAAAETELRELRSAGAVFGLLDVDDEFFVIVRPAPAGARLLLSDATAALDYDIAAEVLEKLDNDIEPDELRTRGGNFIFESAAVRYDDGAMAAASEDAHEIERAPVGGASMQCGCDDEHGERSRECDDVTGSAID